MKSPLLSLALLALITALLAFTFRDQFQASYTGKKPVPAHYQQVIRCSPDWEALSQWLEETDIPPIPGAGSYTWSISSRHDSARFYFNQGINMYYSFHIIEAMASFKKASRFDPESAILYWAQALAYGPNINDYGYAATPAALAAVSKAQQFSTGASVLEKALINAMAVRYTADSSDTNRRQLNEAYTAKMAELYQSFPGQGDVAALYADAMMLEHPWDLWTPDGNPKPWTPRIRQVLEKALASTPQNPGLNHYYIHVMEPSPEAAKALASADRLGKLTPGLSHTVHMPSHIYLRTGHYNKGVSVNESAVQSYQQTIPLYAPVTGADFLYIIHNLHMQVNNAMMAGRYTTSAQSAADLVNSIPPGYLDIPGAMGNLVQYVYMTPVFTEIRFGRWQKLLEYKEPPANQVYSRILWQFGRGMALTRTQKLNEAKLALAEIKVLSKDTVLTIPFTPFSPAIDGAMIAIALLEGSILQEENNLPAAIEQFRNAVKIESQMVYNEPRDWLLNPRHYLANAYIIAGRLDEAAKTLSEDLAVNNENGWALYGNWQVLTAQHQSKQSARMKARFEKAFSKADCTISGTVY
jgi:tetratricopeptide (TPR) repeat protein